MSLPGGEGCQGEGISVRHDFFLLKFAPGSVQGQVDVKRDWQDWNVRGMVRD
jgi:hypothetical protein